MGKHPGGAAVIKAICGKDGSASFNGQHGGQKRPADFLAGYKIGELN
ncbi:MAG: cytochrome b5 domain-containing protein [Actinomycetales bacterium]